MTVTLAVISHATAVARSALRVHPPSRHTTLRLRAKSAFSPRTAAAASGAAAVSAGGSEKEATDPRKMQVAVTGAGGRTGSLVMKLLSEQRGAFAAPRGLVRSSKSADKVRGVVADAGADACVLVEGNISDPAVLTTLCEGCDALVILTSAVPKPRIFSMVKALVSKVLPWMENKRPEFYFPDDGTPEQVDWLWQKTQIDAALAAGVTKIVLVSSMGGTQLDNFLNTMGGGGAVGAANILLWKRKAEMYLVASGADYTVVHPGGLLNKDGGKRELLVGMDDELLKGDRRSVPRADVAAFVVRCLDAPEASNLSFDLASREEGEGSGPTQDLAGLLGALVGRTYDYSQPKDAPVPLP
eukprot:CAMPEP_0181367378 /NCGR_PEP_ID=MMETSP1106-20121128/11352_1 /TAXON_ID=81844 /ORGANISM="Mantoniella antarctica, Strain SL-175" /LENGTH=355 /DNA_ID=CAMNT_0023483083 /DNA_START=38 /DNA_END=1105 /DNA_ORIENTATION=+